MECQTGKGESAMTVLEEWQQLAERENRRVRSVWSAGVADDGQRGNPVKTLDDSDALAARLKPLFEAWLPPEQIAVHEQISETAVWQALAVHLRTRYEMKRCALPPVFYRMRLERINALRALGLKRKQIVAQLGVSEWIMDADLKRVREGEMKADVIPVKPESDEIP